MKEVFSSFAKYNEGANRAFLSIIDKLSNDEREKERGSYYGSLSGIARHLLEGEVFFLQALFKKAVASNVAAQKAIDSVEGFVVPKGKLDESQWKSLTLSFAAANGALVNFVSALSDKRLQDSGGYWTRRQSRFGAVVFPAPAVSGPRNPSSGTDFPDSR